MREMAQRLRKAVDVAVILTLLLMILTLLLRAGSQWDQL
jgi:hypothetical protein